MQTASAYPSSSHFIRKNMCKLHWHTPPHSHFICKNTRKLHWHTPPDSLFIRKNTCKLHRHTPPSSHFIRKNMCELHWHTPPDSHFIRKNSYNLHRHTPLDANFQDPFLRESMHFSRQNVLSAWPHLKTPLFQKCLFLREKNPPPQVRHVSGLGPEARRT